MTVTPHLALPLIAAAQAQKHVTHNEALATLDALVQLSVLERGCVAPPPAPAEGDRVLVGTGAAGGFAGHAGDLAVFDAGAWRFLTPRAGWAAYVEAEAVIVVHDGAQWRALADLLRQLDHVDRLGVGTGPDAQNPFAAKLNAALFTARGVAEGGTGSLRIALNKEGTAATVSQLYQTGYGGRAEAGLIGSDDFSIKVSPDGVAWREALRVRVATGLIEAGGPVRLPSCTVATLPSPAVMGAGALVYVSDESSGAVVAFCDGTGWRRVTDRAPVT